MNDRLGIFIESIIFIIVFCFIYWFLGFIILKLFKKEIRNSTGYTICVIGAFLFKRLLIDLLQ
jgi:short subunit fatty acids transporter